MNWTALGAIGEIVGAAGAGDVWTRGLSGLDALKNDEEWWRLRKDWFGEDFQAYVDDRMPKTTGALVDDFRRPPQANDPPEVAGDSSGQDRGPA